MCFSSHVIGVIVKADLPIMELTTPNAKILMNVWIQKFMNVSKFATTTTEGKTLVHSSSSSSFFINPGNIESMDHISYSLVPHKISVFLKLILQQIPGLPPSHMLYKYRFISRSRDRFC